MPAVQHQVVVIGKLHGVRLIRERLHDRTRAVIRQQHDVRQLQPCPLPDGHARGNALRNGRLSRTDEALRTPAVIVLLQVNAPDQPPAQLPPVQAAFHQHHAVRSVPQDAAQAILHGGVNAGYAVGRLVQPHLRQNQPQGGGCIAHQLLCPLPVIRLAGVLVAGNDRPARA